MTEKHKMLLLNPDGPIELPPDMVEKVRGEYEEASSIWIEQVEKKKRPELGLLVYTTWYSIDDFNDDYLSMTENAIPNELFEKYKDLWEKHSKVLQELAKTLEEAIWWEILANEPELLED